MTTDHTLHPDPGEEAYWNGLRHQLMLDPTVTYLNNGSFGPCARVVFDTVVEYMRQLQSQPFHQFLNEFPGLIRASKEKLGAYVGADPENFALVMNLTAGMNMVANGLDLPAGSEILSTDQEYGAVNNCWEYVAKQKGWKINRAEIPTPPERADQIVDTIAAAVTSKTKILMISHITTTTGLIMPVKRLARLARDNGIFSVIDGAHAPGMIPLHIEDIGADFYVGNCHKWLMGPMGSAFLHARPEVQEQLKPSVVGWGLSWPSLRQRLRTLDASSYMHRLFEFLGTRDLSPFAGVGAAVDFQRGIGIDRIAARGRRLARYLRTRLQARIPGVSFLTPDQEDMSGSITAFTMPAIGDIHLMQTLWERYRIQILGGPPQDGVARCRISTHYYNSYMDIDRLIDALDALRMEA